MIEFPEFILKSPVAFHCLPAAQVVIDGHYMLIMMATEVEVSVLEPMQGDT